VTTDSWLTTQPSRIGFIPSPAATP
jgi:hypothetical protein